MSRISTGKKQQTKDNIQYINRKENNNRKCTPECTPETTATIIKHDSRERGSVSEKSPGVG